MKPWYTSKTIWANVIALAALFIQMHSGFLIPGEAQAALLTVINLGLRAVTNTELV